MDCMEARALKPSLLSELAAKSNQQAFRDDFLCFNGITGVSSNDFSVDVFLDLSNEDYKDGVLEDESEEEEKDSVSESEQDRGEDDGFNALTFSGALGSGCLPAGELALPVEELENLEWLSRFVDDSASELSLLCPAGVFKEKAGNNSVNRSEPPVVQKPPLLCFPPPVPVKARTKRSRGSGQTWSRGSYSSTPSSSSGSSPTSMLVFTHPVPGTDITDEVVKPAAKKQKNRPALETTGGSPAQQQRRCSHCQVQKTPQWRTGPLGPKTLCNACGVRYKSGRLFPEYRPACSPTFSGDIHSNSHRKVLEMRRKKDLAEAGASSGITSMITPS